MDPIALSIGMQGDFNVSLDGMKAQLDAERALAGQRIKDREKRQAEIDDIYKTSVDITDPSKYLPVYHDDIRAKTQSFVQEMDEAVKSGEPRMQIMQRVSKLKEDLGAHRMSTDLVMDAAKKGTVPPDVLRAAMDKNGSVALVDAAQRNFQTLVPVTEGGSQILFPEEVKGTFDDTMKGLRTMELNREYDQNGTKTFQIPGSPDRALILENSQTPAQERAAIIDYTVEYLLSPSQAPNTIMKVFGGNSMDLYEAGPNGQGLVLKPENRAKVAQLATEYLNANPHLRSQTTSIYKKDDGGAPRAGVLQTDS